MMDWPTSTLILGSFVTCVTAWLGYMKVNKKSNKLNKSENNPSMAYCSDHDRREVDIEWRAKVTEKISNIENQQSNFEKSLDELRKDVKDDFKTMGDKLDGVKDIIMNLKK